MPDTKLNGVNLREHLRRHLVAYIAVIAALMALTELVWTVTTPRVPDDRQVLIYLAGPYSDSTALDSVAADVTMRCREDFPELESVAFEGLLFMDPEESMTGRMLLMTRLATGEGDAFLASQDAMDALVSAGACLPLDEYWADGWLSGCGLEPYYAEAGEAGRRLCGLRIDALHALYDLGAFDNRGAYLAVAANGRNLDSTLRAVALAAEALIGEDDA